MCFFFQGKIKQKLLEKQKEEQRKILLAAKMKLMMSTETLILRNPPASEASQAVNTSLPLSPTPPSDKNELNELDISTEPILHLQSKYDNLRQTLRNQNERLEESEKKLQEFDNMKNHFYKLQSKYENLKNKYNEQTERLESVLIFNERLQKMAFINENSSTTTGKFNNFYFS